MLQDMQARSFPHLSYGLNAMDWHVASAERQSIERRDLFGPDEEIYDQPASDLDDGGADDVTNPFERFLSQLTAETAPIINFEAWSRYGDPRFTVCRDIALSITGGDETLADQILNGNAPLHRAPSGLGKIDQRAALIQWLKSEAAASQERLAKLFEDLGFNIGGDASLPSEGVS